MNGRSLGGFGCRASVLIAALWLAQPAAAQDEGAEPEADESQLVVRVFGGVGLGTRDFTFQTPAELRSVETGPFAALEVGASFLFAVSDSFSLGPMLVYQTSFAHEIEETHIAGASDELGIRSHRFDATLAATIAIGSAGFRLALAAGVAVQNLRPEVHHLLTPAYSSMGPLGRLIVRIPFTQSFALRLAPEVAWMVPGYSLEELGLRDSGLLVGGEIAFELAVSDSLALELAARDALAWLPSSIGEDATDNGMFATTRVVWQP